MKNISIKKTFVIALFTMLLFFVVGLQDADAQCAMCRASVETNYNNGDGEASNGLNTGILYLLSMPYVLIGTVAFLWYRKNKKNREKKSLQISGYSSM